MKKTKKYSKITQIKRLIIKIFNRRKSMEIEELLKKCVNWHFRDHLGRVDEIVIPLSQDSFFFSLERRTDLSEEGKHIQRKLFEKGDKRFQANFIFDKHPNKRILCEEASECFSFLAESKNISINTVRFWIKDLRDLLSLKSCFKSFKNCDDEDVREVINEAERRGFEGVGKLIRNCISFHNQSDMKQKMLQIASRRILQTKLQKCESIDLESLKKIRARILAQIIEIKSVYSRFDEYEKLWSEGYFSAENVAKTFLVARENRGFVGSKFVRSFFKGIVDYTDEDELLELSKGGIDLLDFRSEERVYLFLKTVVSRGKFESDGYFEIRTKPLNSYWKIKNQGKITAVITNLCPNARAHLSTIFKFLRPSSEFLAPFFIHILFDTGANADVLINAQKKSLRTKVVGDTQTALVFSGFKSRADRLLEIEIPMIQGNELYENFTFLLKIMKNFEQCEKLSINAKVEPFLFKNYYQKGKLNQIQLNSINEVLKSLAKEIGIESGRLGTRTLRKNFLTQLALDGASPIEIQEVAQHRSLEMQKHYTSNKQTEEERFVQIPNLQAEIVDFSINTYINQLEFSLKTSNEDVTLAPPSSLIFDRRAFFEPKHYPALLSLMNFAVRQGGRYYDEVAKRIGQIFKDSELDSEALAQIEVESRKFNDYIAHIENAPIILEKELELGGAR